MGTCFGEVVFPVSRVADEEDYSLDDDIDHPVCTLLATYLEDGDAGRKYQNLLVLDPQVANGIRHAIQKSKLIARLTVEQSEKKEFAENSGFSLRKITPLEVFALDDSTCVVLTNDEIPDDSLHAFAVQVTSFGTPDATVAVLTAAPAAMYQNDVYREELDAPFVRSVATSPYTNPLPAAPLEQPNFLSGIPAAVLSRCQIDHIPAVCIAVYIDSRVIDSVAWDALKSVVSKTPGAEKIGQFKVLGDRIDRGGNLYL